MLKATADSGVNIATFIDGHVPDATQTAASSNILVVNEMATEAVETSEGARITTTTALVVSAATATVPIRTRAEHLEVSLEMMEDPPRLLHVLVVVP